MEFDLNKLPRTLAPIAGVNGALHERSYRRYAPKWWYLTCQHQAFRIFTEDTFPTEQDDYVIQTRTLSGCNERLLLVTSECLVCGKTLLEGRLRQGNGKETTVGIQYIRTKDKVTPAPKDISEKDLIEFYNREWEFKKDLLADFNKLTIAVAVAASVFFDTHPLVFYTFIVTCFIMIALYCASYIGQKQITKQYYGDSMLKIGPTYKASFDTASKYLQVIFGLGIVVVLCSMIRAERINLMNKKLDNTNEKTIPYNPPTKTRDTRPYNPAKIEPNTTTETTQIQPEKTQTPQIQPEKTQTPQTQPSKTK